MAGRRRKSKPVYSPNNKVTLIRGGKAYFDKLLEMIGSAKESIHLQTYIYSNDDTGRHVADSLKAAAARKVKVYLLVDGYASKGLGNTFIHDIRNAGVHFRYFNPLMKSKHFYFGRRLHHKMVVVDAKYALVGGVNVSNKYNDIDETKAWLDFAVHIEGEAARELCILCWKTWRNYPSRMATTPCEKLAVEWNIPEKERSKVSIRRNDWVRRKNEISATYIDMFRNAQSHITILCSYFLPGRVIRRQLRYAAQRGVKIRVITAGVSDVILAKYAERFLYDWLLRYNIDLYEYQTTILHGKIAVCDGEWMTIGSYNINDISAYASIELNMNIQNENLAREAERILLGIAEKESVHVTSEYYIKRKNIFKQFAHWCSFQFIRFVLFLFTFYFKRSKLTRQ